jgi:hypothetical protein
MNHVKKVIETLIVEIHYHIPSHGLMEALGVVLMYYLHEYFK